MASLLPLLLKLNQPQAVGLPTRQIRDQDHVNCCFSCALAAALEGYDPALPALAPLYHFYFAAGPRAMDEGLTVSQARATLLRKGICTLRFHFFDISPASAGLPPNDAAVRDGIQRRPCDAATGDPFWTPVSSVDPERAWKRYLRSGFPIVAALQPNGKYFGLDAAGPRLMDNSGPYNSTGHVVAIIGYSDAESAFIVQDSRGTAFGLGGQWFLPYDLCSTPFVVLAFVLAPTDFQTT